MSPIPKSVPLDVPAMMTSKRAEPVRRLDGSTWRATTAVEVPDLPCALSRRLYLATVHGIREADADGNPRDRR